MLSCWLTFILGSAIEHTPSSSNTGIYSRSTFFCYVSKFEKYSLS